jgi:glycosidase
MKKIFASFMVVFMFGFMQSCFLQSNEKKEAKTEEVALVDGHPAWIMQGNIYEVNVRQYTAEGTFKAFEQHLQRLKDMGVQTLWFMPINPISKLDRKGVLGSYYAIADYKAINPEYGNLQDWKALVKKAHEMGFKVIIDWVANHTGADHYWLKTNPDFYAKDSTGKPISPFDWTDVKKLNYANTQLHDSMINCMKYWISESDIDGFRCDVAAEVPAAFWSKAIADLKKTKPGLFFLAEGSVAWLHEAGFDETYAWDEFNVMKQIAKGDRTALSLDTVLNKIDTSFPKNALRLFFTSNHDENSWNKADYGTMPGASHAPFAVLTQTIVRSVPLIYSGQEEPFLDSISFFYKDTIRFSKYERSSFYQTLLHLRTNNQALAANASYKKISTGNNQALFAYARENNGKKVLVILNLSAAPQTAVIGDYSYYGNATNVFSGQSEALSAKPIVMEPWAYRVYTY